jgi:hypothetical protein
VIEREHLSRQKRRLTEGNHADESPDPQPCRLAGERGEKRPGLEVAVARREKIVVYPGAVKAEIFGRAPQPYKLIEGSTANVNMPKRIRSIVPVIYIARGQRLLC